MSSIGSISSSNNYYQQINFVGSNSKSSRDDTFKTALDALVSDGTITQDQEDTITEKLATPSDDTNSASASSTSTNSSNSDNPLKNTLDSLVSDGTITDDQENAITKALTSQSNDTDSSASATSSSTDNPLKSALDSLVSDGTITQDQEDVIAQMLAPPSDTSNMVSSVYSELYGSTFSYLV